MIDNGSKFNKKRLRFTPILLIVVIIIILTFVFLFPYSPLYINRVIKQNPENTVDYNQATIDQQKNGNTIKNDTIKNNNTDKPPIPTPIPGNTKNNVQLNITSANQNGSILQIRILISAIDNNGECKLTLKQDGKNSVVKTTSVQALASISTCQGFDIPMSELSNGAWLITVEYESPTLTGTITKNINLD